MDPALLDAALTTFVTLFVVIDPIGLTPIFIALTAGMDARARRRIGLRGIAVAFFILALFGLGGDQLLQLVGISMPAFRISGGIMLFLIALDMLFESRSARREKNADGHEPDPSVFPLAVPLIAGPGAMATMILLSDQHSAGGAGQAMIYLMLLAVLGICMVLFLMGGLIERLLGRTGIRVVSRLLGVLLGALSVQFVIDGVRSVNWG